MQYEFVEFYPVICKKKHQQLVGTVHIYIYSEEFQFDLRGIMVALYKNKLYFRMPGGKGADSETKEMIRYPYFGFTQKEEQDKFIAFLQKEVSPIIFERLQLKEKLIEI
jgi:hypothetical protein